MESNTETFQWPPLESDPEIFNNYFHKIGLPSHVEFDELWSLDYKEVQIIDSPIIGVICAVKNLKGKNYNEENLLDFKSVPFFMKQQGSLDNACGLVASLHCLGNNNDYFKINENSILGNIFEKFKHASPEERCKILEEDNKFKEVHLSSSGEGQSSMPITQEKVCCHYIAFVSHDNNLIELDGTLPGPHVIKNNCTIENLLDHTIEELKKRINNGFISENLSVIILKLN